MAKELFHNYPLVDYDLIKYKEYQKAVNITLRPVLRKKIKNYLYIYYPYIIREGERPDIIADKYYGHPSYFWLVYFSNDIIDPYFEWPLDHYEFNEYIEQKYGDLETGVRGIEYATQNIKFYKTQSGYIVDKFTFDNLTGVEAVNKSTQTYYDWEIEKNNSKREIKLIGNQFLDAINKEISKVLYV